MGDVTYVYQGPITGVSLKGGKEVMLYPGVEVSLPDDNGYVKTLVAMGRLKEKVKPKAEAAPVKATPADKTKIKDGGIDGTS